MNGTKQGGIEEKKDLGVMVNQSLKPSVQVAMAAKKANQLLRQILCAFTYRNKEHYIKL